MAEPRRFHPFDLKLELAVSEHRLPHWTQEGATCFVTFRTADSLPYALLDQWQLERATWMRKNPPPWTARQETEYRDRFPRRMESWLDEGMGSCALRQDQVRRQVERALRHFDGERYDLDAFVLMPNHVHLLITPAAGQDLFNLLQGIKAASARRCNGLLGLTDSPFWVEDSYIRIVRDWKELNLFRRYIAENPVKAGLEAGAFTLVENHSLTP